MRYPFVFLAFFFLPLQDFACSCGHVGIIKNKRQVAFVFAGRVKNVNETLTREFEPATNDSIDYRVTRYTFDVLKNYKGLEGKRTIELLSGMTDCEMSFDRGETYIVYAYTDDRKMHYRLTNQKIEPYITTHLCTRTKKRTILTFWETLVLWLS